VRVQHSRYYQLQTSKFQLLARAAAVASTLSRIRARRTIHLISKIAAEHSTLLTKYDSNRE